MSEYKLKNILQTNELSTSLLDKILLMASHFLLNLSKYYFFLKGSDIYGLYKNSTLFFT